MTRKITKIESLKLENKYSNKKKVCGYARVSTKYDDQSESLKTQTEYYKNYIKNNKDWEYAGVYIDKGVSGKSVGNRLGFNKMIIGQVLLQAKANY